MNFIVIYVLDSYLLSRVINKRYFKFSNRQLIKDFSSFETCYEEMKKEPPSILLINTDLFDYKDIDVLNLIKKEFPKTKIILEIPDNNKRKAHKILSYCVNAYITSNTKNLSKVVECVLHNGFWVDMEIAQYLFSSFSGVNGYKNDYNKLKNILTTRELEVLKLITLGKTNSEIAREIIISTNTAKAHVGSILEKLSVTDRVQAAVIATKANLF